MSHFYVTTSIPYVNGEPHLGHAMEMVIADVIARYARAQGKDVIFSTGTDEHGGKINEKAVELGITPDELAAKMSNLFKQLGDHLEISNNRFIRTTDKAHEQRAKLIWKDLEADIYKGKYIGWYCTGDEAYFTETEVKANNGVCPNHNRPYEKIEEENYFFRLSKYTKQIITAIEDNTFKIYPDTKRNEVLRLLESGLDDISISRPKEKLDWGIDVPGDKNQVMYVWFEALMNYITVLGFPEHADFKNFWPADFQVIGKDISRFHAAIWPAMLLSLGLELPKNLYIHGFVNVDGKKMSKSLGNYVSPLEIINDYGSDAFRYFFLRHIPSYSDGDFSWSTFIASYNNELANELGNLVQRTVVMIENYQAGEIGDIPPPEHDIASYQEAIAVCHFDHALDAVWVQVRGLNQYIEEAKPWVIAKSEDKEHLQEVLAYQVGSLIEIAILLEPFMPDTAEKIKSIFRDGKTRSLKTMLFPKKETTDIAK
jgi:methionyl-tRNA synthetase